jgi:hypothetical protein
VSRPRFEPNIWNADQCYHCASLFRSLLYYIDSVVCSSRGKSSSSTHFIPLILELCYYVSLEGIYLIAYCFLKEVFTTCGWQKQNTASSEASNLFTVSLCKFCRGAFISLWKIKTISPPFESRSKPAEVFVVLHSFQSNTFVGILYWKKLFFLSYFQVVVHNPFFISYGTDTISLCNRLNNHLHRFLNCHKCRQYHYYFPYRL